MIDLPIHKEAFFAKFLVRSGRSKVFDMLLFFYSLLFILRGVYDQQMFHLIQEYRRKIKTKEISKNSL